MDYREKLEIDLIDLLHYLLKRWRSLIAFMLLGAILGGAYGYLVPRKVTTSTANSSSSASSSASTPEEETFFEISEKLSETEKDEVIKAIKNYLSYEKNYEERSDYGKDSFRMTIDALRVPTYVTTYKISDYKTSDSLTVSDVSEVDNIVTMYKMDIFDQSVIDNIREATGWDDVSDAYVKELLKVSKSGKDLMAVTIIAPTWKECTMIMGIIDKKITTSFGSIKLICEHNIEKTDQSYYEDYSSTLLDQQSDITTALVNLEKTMQGVSSAMSATQKAFYMKLLDAVRENVDDEGNVDINEVLAKTLSDSEKETLLLRAEEEADTAVEEATTTIAPRSLRPKMVLLGAFGGLFALLIIYSAIYALSSKLRTSDEITALFGCSVIGEFAENDQYNKAFGGVDKFIDGLFTRGKASVPVAEQLRIIAAAIGLEAGASPEGKILLTGTCTDDKANNWKNSIMECIEKSGITSSVNNLKNSPLLDSEAMQNLAESDVAVLVEKIGSSRYEDIANMVELCKKYNVKVLGSVVVK